MKKLTLISAILVLVLCVFTSKDGITLSSNFPSGYTGAPGDFGSCQNSSCHGTVQNGTFSISTTATGYVPGQQIVLNVSLNDNTKVRYGFSLTSLKSSDNTFSGSLTNINNTGVSVQTVNNRTYVGHSPAGSTNSWNVLWTAPTTDVGDIVFYAGGVAANNANGDNGDHAYVTSFRLSAASNPSTPLFWESISLDKNVPMPYPNPCTSTCTIEGEVQTLVSSNGLEYIPNGKKVGKNYEFQVDGLPSGIYTIQMKSGKSTKLVVQ